MINIYTLKFKKSQIINYIFAFTFGIYSFLSVLSWSQISTYFSNFNEIYTVYKLISVLIFFLIFIYSKPTINEFFIFVLIETFFLYGMLLLKITYLFMFVGILFASKNINYHFVLKIDLFFKILGFLLICFFYRAGYFFNVVAIRYNGDGRLRESLGFNYPTYFMYIIMLLGIEWILIRNKQITYLEYLIIFLIGIWANNITDARGESITLYFVCVGTLLINKTNFKVHNNILKNCLKYFLILLPEIICLLSFTIVTFLKNTSTLYSLLNKFTSQRLGVFQFYLNEYGVHLFPNKVQLNFSAADGHWISVIDNSYLFLGIEFGFISLLIYLGIYSFLIWKTEKNKEWNWVVILIAFLILNMVEYVSLAPVIAIYCISLGKEKIANNLGVNNYEKISS